MSLTTAQKWRKIIAWLRRNFPAQYPVYVKSIPMKKLHGLEELFYRPKKYFRILISRNESFELRADALLHGWAHFLTWFGAETHEEHSSEWGIAYAKILRTFEEWNYGRCAKTESQ